MQSDKKIPDRNQLELLEPVEPFVSSLKTLEERWTGFLGVGVTLMVLGILAVAAAPFAGIFTIIALGILLCAGAITKVIAAFWAKKWSGFWLSLLIGVLYGVMGIICLVKKGEALAALTLIMGALFLVGGLTKMISSLFLRFESWGWVFFSGLVSLLLGILVIAGWPESSLWLVGTFVGVDLIFSGWVWIALACETRRIAKEQGRA